MILIVIPVRNGGNAEVTLKSLEAQTYKDYDIVVVNDTENKGANWARNEGFKMLRGHKYVLFSDDDIEWYPTALETLTRVLDDSGASYCYGGYEMNGQTYCNKEFNAEDLKKGNYISTMSLIKAHAFPGFDESLQKLQDWDLWLTMYEDGCSGVYCGETIFKTNIRDGISYGPNAISSDQATEIVKKKHNL